MDPHRRRLLLLAGTSLVAARAGVAATDAAPALRLEARALEGADPARGPLSYRRPADTPVLRVAKGGRIAVSLTNGLSEPTALDWHGMRLANALDARIGLGGALVAPGASVAIDLRPAESGTSWFHPPFMPGGSDQTARGLSGVLVVEEASPPEVEDDVILFLADRLSPPGAGLAEVLTLNREALPATRTYRPGARLRLRLVNGSTRRAVEAAFEPASVTVIAIDGQPCELFRPLGGRLPLGPGARCDVVLDLPREGSAAPRVMLRGVSAAEPDATLFVARLEGRPMPPRPPLAALEPNRALPPAIALERAVHREVVVGESRSATPGGAAFSLDGSASLALPKAPLFAAKRGTAVTIGLANRTPRLVGFRAHGQAMRQLHSLDDGWEPYWRDSILVPPGRTFHAAFQADAPGRWLIESPFFDQAATGLRHWFEIA